MKKHFKVDLAKSKIKCIEVNRKREMLYGLDGDKQLSVVSLREEKLLDQIKCFNLTPKAMVIVEDLNRLYVIMKEPGLFVFDVESVVPIVLKTVVFPAPISRILVD